MINSHVLNKHIFPLGIGGWGLGGFAEKDSKNNDKEQIDALIYMMSRGMNLATVNFWNSEGKSVDLIRKAYKEYRPDREKFVLHQSIYNYRNPSFQDARAELEKMTEKFDAEYIDSLEFIALAYNVYKKAEIFDFYHEELDLGRIKAVSVANASLPLLKELKKEFGDKVFAHELNFGFEIRENEDYGLTGFARDSGILNIAFQVLRRNRTAKRNWPLLVELAQKYGKTQNQIILNWVVSKGFLALFKSQNKKHIDENLDAVDFEMSKDDFKRIDDFRPPKWKSPEIDWEYKGNGVRVDQLANVFDEMYGQLK